MGRVKHYILVSLLRAHGRCPTSSCRERGKPLVLRSRPIRELDAQEAYIAALDRDTLPNYLAFLDSYATDPLANTVRAIVAARREALIWRLTRGLDTPAAYWPYLRLYSDGPHVGDCYRRLAFCTGPWKRLRNSVRLTTMCPHRCPTKVPTSSSRQFFWATLPTTFPPPPLIPASFLPPPPPEFVELSPPEPPEDLVALPTPIYTPLLVRVRPPRFRTAPSCKQCHLPESSQQGCTR